MSVCVCVCVCARMRACVYVCIYVRVCFEWSESARNNFGKFILQFQPETKTLIRKLKGS